MKLGIDISQIVYKGTGVARFTDGLVNAILQYDKKNDWLFFFSSLRSNIDKDLENKILKKSHRIIKWKIPPTLLSFLWNNLHFKFKIFNDLDWFITSDWIEPSLYSIKKATIVHDLVYLRYPETVDQKIKLTQKQRLNWVKKESKVIFADSFATRDDLIALLNIDPKKIVVNYPGVETSDSPKSTIDKTLNKYRLIKPFILTVGKLEPRKNIKRLIEAFEQLNNDDVDLVIAGHLGWDVSINRLIDTDKTNVHFLGYVADDELYSLYKSCLFFVYPSIWEGFGYPIVEAMRLGIPVATSDTSSLKEIAQDSALTFNPLNQNEIAKNINMMIKNKGLRESLIKKGYERSRIFTWKSYYEKMINVLSTNI